MMDSQVILGQVSEIRHPISAIEVFTTIDSTNALLWERWRDNASMPRVAIAVEQTAGRGQWGRSWESGAGGLYLSMVLPLALEPQNAYGLTLASAWGIADQLRQRAIPVEIKWANDLLLNNRKLGGIKTETKIQDKKIIAAVIGVGINYTNLVPEMGINLQEFWQGELRFSLESLAALVITGISRGIDSLQTESWAKILPQYLSLLKNLGETILYEGQVGKIIGVNEKGELLVKMAAVGASSTIKIPPGQISLGYSSP